MKIYIEIFDREKFDAEMQSGKFPFAMIIIEERRHQPRLTYIVTPYVKAWQMERVSQVARIVEIVDEEER